MDIREALNQILKDKGCCKDGLLEAASSIATHVGEILKVHPEEVAIMLLTSTMQSLKFIHPKQLFNAGSVIPINHKSAIAATVFQSKKGKVDNKITESKHLKFFENVRNLELKTKPIQKMIALPIIFNGNTLGVVELSRKGETPEKAGSNFTQNDATTLLAIVNEVAPFLLKLKPEPFL